MSMLGHEICQHLHVIRAVTSVCQYLILARAPPWTLLGAHSAPPDPIARFKGTYFCFLLKMTCRFPP